MAVRLHGCEPETPSQLRRELRRMSLVYAKRFCRDHPEGSAVWDSGELPMPLRGGVAGNNPGEGAYSVQA